MKRILKMLLWIAPLHFLWVAPLLFLITTEAAAVQIDTTSMPNGNRCAPYNQFIVGSGAQGSPIMWSLKSGSLPDGLSISKYYGVQSTIVPGTPTTVQSKTFTVQAKDPANGQTALKTLTITIDPPLTLVINNPGNVLADGTRGQSYSAYLFSDGGCAPRTWAITAGALPPGLHLSGNVISGTPTTAGTFTFTARVSSQDGQQVSRQFSITIH